MGTSKEKQRVTEKKCRRKYQIALACICLLAGVSIHFESGAQAAGFYIQELGTPRSLVTAWVANPASRGGGASWSNTAGMVFIDSKASKGYENN